MEPYRDRPIRFLGLRTAGAWRLKTYSVVYGDEPYDAEGFAGGLALAEASLPAPDESAGRPGLGFLIVHQGKTGDYVVLGWWNSENELPLSVWVRRAQREPWRAAAAGESVCVWDLEIVWGERQAWVQTMLTRDPDPDRYLAWHGEPTRD